MRCWPLGRQAIESCIIHEQDTWVSSHIFVPYSNKGLRWATRLALAQRKSGSTRQYDETSAWSRKGSHSVGYKWHLKANKAKTVNVTHRNALLVYSLFGSISWPFTSIFLLKSKVDRTEAAASVTIEWARCLPGQILTEWSRTLEEATCTSNVMLTSYRTQMQCPSDL